MKLRLKENSIRLRLTKGDVERLMSDGHVKESLEFGASGTAFSYSLAQAAVSNGLTAEHRAGSLIVYVGREDARSWAESEQVGMTGSTGGGLQILVEKDFACMSAREGEDETDMYPNPAAAIKI